ncbi:hypothetical protein IG631_06755 [Alternaria alternata]|nr:hypothetical protein IG631_06755 [Alternaria alternata]
MSTEKIYYHLKWPNPSWKSDTTPAFLHGYTNNEILAKHNKAFEQTDQPLQRCVSDQPLRSKVRGKE